MTTLDAQLENALQAWPLFSQGEAVVSVEEAGERMSCTLVALDSLACAFTNLELSSPRLANVDTKQLQTIADRLAKRLTYLLEPINPIETDSQGAASCKCGPCRRRSGLTTSTTMSYWSRPPRRDHAYPLHSRAWGGAGSDPGPSHAGSAGPPGRRFVGGR